MALACLISACASNAGSSASTDTATSAATTTAAATTTVPVTTIAATTTAPTTTSSTTTAPATTVSPDVPDRVSGVAAYPGGGSGEVQVEWNAAADATGYRITIAGSAGGPYTLIATIHIGTGSVSAEAGVVNIWSEQHTYLPGGSAPSGTDTSSEFFLVHLSGAGERCFKVIAFNDAGRAGASSAACSGPL